MRPRLNWTVRIAVVALVGAYIFAFLPGYPAIKITAFVAAVLATVVWALAERSEASHARYAALLPYSFGAMTVTCALAAATPEGGPILVLGFIGALAVGRNASLTTGSIICGLAIAAVALAELASKSYPWGTVGSVAATLLGALLIGQNSRAYQLRAQQAAELLAKSEQLRQEQAWTAALDERTRIAREVHDVLAHSLGALGLQIEVARAVLTDSGEVSRAVELLDQARRMASEGLGETRRAVHALRGEISPLPEGLAELSANHQRQHGTPVRFEVSGEPRPLPPDAGLAITRAAQEALVNTAKHAPYQPVDMQLDYTGPGTRLVVTNHLAAGNADSNGSPAIATVDGGYGLAGMRERLLLLDGALSAGQQGSDWIVEATVPQ
ncbi:MAG TPA: histidine kinase [Streptosporangiaceae bacterium]|nr:histidine kinase [Streptosporangiaceae bacterium]